MKFLFNIFIFICIAVIAFTWLTLSFGLGYATGYENGLNDGAKIMSEASCKMFCEYEQAKHGEIVGECGFQNNSKTCEEWLK